MLPSHEIAVERLVTRSLLACPPETPLREAARRMAQHRSSAIVVMAGDTPVGIWTERDALALDPADAEGLAAPVSTRMSHPVQSLPAATTAGEAALRFKRQGIRHALVTDADGKALGMLTQSDIVLNQGAEFFLRMKTVGSVAGRAPTTLGHERPLREAFARMREAQADALVIDYGEGAPGILTQRDLVRLLADGQGTAPAGAVASRPLRAVPQGTTLYAARQLLVEHQIRHLGVLADDGSLAGLLGFGDILANIEFEYVHELQHALRERDEALWASRYHLRLADKVFDSTLEGIMVTDAHGIIERVNPAFTRLTGYSAEEAVGQRARLLSSGRQPPEFYAAMWRDLRETGHWQGEIWNRRKDGELYLEHLTISGIRGEDGRYSHYAAVFADITQRKLAEERLSYLATHDALTGLPNRSLFTERLERATARALRTGRRVALAFIDLDRFKRVNDTYGHGTGDRLLRAAAERLQQGVRGSDTVARMGGDEFTLVLEEIQDVQHVAHILQKLLSRLAEPFDIDGTQIVVTPSIGVSLCPDDSDHPQQLLVQADLAMYRAKECGKNNFQFYADDMNTSARQHLRLESELRHAIAHGQLELHYQPRLHLQLDRIAGAEALVRWRHPSRGLVPPGEFIPLAEESSLIVDLGEWVLREACRQRRAWFDDGLDVGRVSVNVSMRQLRHPQFLAGLDDILAATRLPASLLELELTESLAMGNHPGTLPLLQAIAERGVGLAIDDFGTGYSSFGQLHHLPVDTLKIDRSLLGDVAGDVRRHAIIRAIVAMARALGLDAVMEGVETPEQAEALRRIGCQQVQGFWYARPMPADALARFAADAAAPARCAAP